MHEPIPAERTEAVAQLAAGSVLDLGCGGRKREPAWIGIDVLPLEDVDIVGEARVALQAMESASVEGIFSSHFFEHVENVGTLLAEVTRVLKPGGWLDITVPHFSNAYFYSDPTHKTAFGLYSMSYFVAATPFSRQVPMYGEPLPLDLADVQLRFKSSRPFYVRYGLRRLAQVAVNTSRWTQEFYEENLTGLLSCYEVNYRLRTLQSRGER